MAKKAKEEVEEIKVILLGDSGVGKTNLINVSLGHKFDETMEVTINPSYSAVNIKLDKKEYLLNLWDTAGQEKYRRVTKLFFKGSEIIILVYDITNSTSFESLQNWYQECEDIIDSPHIYGVVGNKNDKYQEQQVEEKKAKEFAESINSPFQILSAKETPQLFSELLKQLTENYIKNNVCKRRNSVKLNNSTKPINKKGCCD